MEENIMDFNLFSFDKKINYKIMDFGHSEHYPICDHTYLNNNILEEIEIDNKKFLNLFYLSEDFVNIEDHYDIIKYHDIIIEKLHFYIKVQGLGRFKEFISIFENNFNFFNYKEYKYYDSSILTAFDLIKIYYKLILSVNSKMGINSINILKRNYSKIIDDQFDFILLKLKDILHDSKS